MVHLATLPAILLRLQLVEVSVEGGGRHPLVALAQLGRGQQHEVRVVWGQSGVARGVDIGLKANLKYEHYEYGRLGELMLIVESSCSKNAPASAQLTLSNWTWTLNEKLNCPCVLKGCVYVLKGFRKSWRKGWIRQMPWHVGLIWSRNIYTRKRDYIRR